MKFNNHLNVLLKDSSKLFSEAEGDDIQIEDVPSDTTPTPPEDTSFDMDMSFDDTGDVGGDTGASLDEMADPMAGLDEHSGDMGDMGMDDSMFDTDGIDTTEDDVPDVPDKDDEDAKRRDTIKTSFIALFDKYTQIISELKALEFPLEFESKMKPVISEYNRLLNLVDEYIAMYISAEKVIILLKTFVETRAAFDILDNQLSVIKDEYVKFIDSV